MQVLLVPDGDTLPCRVRPSLLKLCIAAHQEARCLVGTHHASHQGGWLSAGAAAAAHAPHLMRRLK